MGCPIVFAITIWALFLYLVNELGPAFVPIPLRTSILVRHICFYLIWVLYLLFYLCFWTSKSMCHECALLGYFIGCSIPVWLPRPPQAWVIKLPFDVKKKRKNLFFYLHFTIIIYFVFKILNWIKCNQSNQIHQFFFNLIFWMNIYQKYST